MRALILTAAVLALCVPLAARGDEPDPKMVQQVKRELEAQRRREILQIQYRIRVAKSREQVADLRESLKQAKSRDRVPSIISPTAGEIGRLSSEAGVEWREQEVTAAGTVIYFRFLKAYQGSKSAGIDTASHECFVRGLTLKNERGSIPLPDGVFRVLERQKIDGINYPVAVIEPVPADVLEAAIGGAK